MEKPDLALVLEEEAPKAKRPRRPRPDAMDDDEEEVPASRPSLSADPEEVEAAAAVRAAMESGDDEEFAKSLKGFIKLCGAGGY